MAVSYNAAVGLSQDMANNLITRLYQLLEQTGLFRRYFSVEKLDFDSVDVNFNESQPSYLMYMKGPRGMQPSCH